MRFFILCKNESTEEKCKNSNLEYIINKSDKFYLNGNDLCDFLLDPQSLNDGDVFMITGSKVKKILSGNDEETFLYVTNKCNSNCIMCPSPEIERRCGTAFDTEDLIKLIDYYPSSISHITITGGEPTLINNDIFKLLIAVKQKLPDVGYLFLTNGRIFTIRKYAERFKEVSPKNTLIGIPLHSYKEDIHDKITSIEGSFKQTIAGIRNLLIFKQHVEIRIVISKMNYTQIPLLCKFIASNFPTTYIVTFICMEMSGNAAMNKESLWISLQNIWPHIDKGVLFLLAANIDFRFYNFPLCTLPSKYWAVAEKSISPEKIRYTEKCIYCTMKNNCGGFFSSSAQFMREEVKPYV